MNDIYRPTIAKHNLQGTAIHVYMDDIVVATRVSSSVAVARAACFF
jgi:hypothetical protein